MLFTCVGLTKTAVKYYLDFPDFAWIYSWSNPPFANVNLSFQIELNTQMNTLLSSSSMEGNEIEDELNGNDVPLNPQESSIVEERKKQLAQCFCNKLEH